MSVKHVQMIPLLLSAVGIKWVSPDWSPTSSCSATPLPPLPPKKWKLNESALIFERWSTHQDHCWNGIYCLQYITFSGVGLGIEPKYGFGTDLKCVCSTIRFDVSKCVSVTQHNDHYSSDTCQIPKASIKCIKWTSLSSSLFSFLTKLQYFLSFFMCTNECNTMNVFHIIPIFKRLSPLPLSSTFFSLHLPVWLFETTTNTFDFRPGQRTHCLR